MAQASLRARVVVPVTLVILLAIPVSWSAISPDASGMLFGHVEEIPARPADLLRGLFDRTTQRWLEKTVDVRLGFREHLVRTFNEIAFRLFRQAPGVRLYATPEHGLYSGMSLDSLNADLTGKRALKNMLREDAAKLLQAQQQLAAAGKYFVVVIAASKPYVYAEGLPGRYLVNGKGGPDVRFVDFGAILEAAGVNVIDGGDVLRRLTRETGTQTHAFAGVHWNYYSGCVVAGKLLDQARARYRQDAPAMDCGDPVAGPLHDTDIDGLKWLNIWSDGGLAVPTPYPSATARGSGWRPKMLLVGDSFAEQMLQPMQQAGIYDRLVISRYLRTREVMEHGWAQATSRSEVKESEQIWPELIADVAEADIVVLQVVDYNLRRRWFGFPEGLVAAMTAAKGQVHLRQVAGAHGRESDGKDWWHWIDMAARFESRALFPDPDSKRSRVDFTYGTLGPQTLSVTLRSRSGAERRTLLRVAQATERARFEGVFDLDAADVLAIEIKTDGPSMPLSPSDPRQAALVVRNLTLSPVR
jgi:hypothetical protein